MPGGSRPDRRALTRADLPEQFTPDTVRRLDVYTVRRLSDPNNGILAADEQRSFDEVLRVVMHDTTERLDHSLRRARGGGPGGLDPQLRRSYARTEQRLAAQARRARQSFPQLTGEWDEPVELPGAAVDDEAADADDAMTLATLEAEIEQTSDTLEILERIASIQEQQLDHQRTQVLRDVRGVFFALLVSVAVIVGGVAPLVEAEAHDRWLIVLWTLVVCGVAGIGYAIVRARQSDRGPTAE